MNDFRDVSNARLVFLAWQHGTVMFLFGLFLFLMVPVLRPFCRSAPIFIADFCEAMQARTIEHQQRSDQLCAELTRRKHK